MFILATLSAEFIYGLIHLFGSYSCKETFRWGFRIKSVRVLMCIYIFLRGIELSQCLFYVPKGAFKATDSVWISWDFSLQGSWFNLSDDALFCKGYPGAVQPGPVRTLSSSAGHAQGGSCRAVKQQMLCARGCAGRCPGALPAVLGLRGQQWQWPSGPCVVAPAWLPAPGRC